MFILMMGCFAFFSIQNKGNSEDGVSLTGLSVSQVSNNTSSNEIPVLMYHLLLPGRNDSISVDPVRFKEQMLALKSSGYTTITETELSDHLEQETPLPEKPILITFDDGYLSNYTEAFPILKRLDMKASIYVVASRIFEDSGSIAGEYPKISWQQAREMRGTISIQSHTWDSHSKQNNDQGQNRGLITGRMQLENGIETQKEFEGRVFEDLIAAKNAIEQNVGTQVTAISYPYGDYSTDTIRLAEKAGYKMAFTVNSGLNSQNSLPFELKRIIANGAYSGDELINIIEAQ